MARETRVEHGVAPRTLSPELCQEIAAENWQFRGDEFLLRGAGHHYFHYRRGKGITVERGPGADLSEESLWLNGSVYSAVASINGLLPIHASAVAWNGEVFAFTGPPGAGKSTLAAALGRHGLPMVCDDTLVLDLSDPDRIYCHPGHKRLKLTEEALALTAASREEKVSMTVEKFYAAPIAGIVREVLPLAELIYLDEGDEIAISPIRGGERIARLQDDHYTTRLFEMARSFDRVGHFRHVTRLAGQFDFSAFVRPRSTHRFDETVAFAARYVTADRSRA